MSSSTDHACDCNDAADAAAASYRADGYLVEVRPLGVSSGDKCEGQLVTVPGLRHAEIVLDSGTDFALACRETEELRSSGWDAWAVVPLARLGEAHGAFSGSADFVQGWWPRTGSHLLRVAFTEPQLP